MAKKRKIPKRIVGLNEVLAGLVILALAVFNITGLDLAHFYGSTDTVASLSTSAATSNINSNTINNSSDGQSDGKSTQQALYCLDHRGSSGHWRQDLGDYVKQAQLNLTLDEGSPVPIKELRATYLFKPTEENPYRWATTWRWEDNHCPIPLATPAGLCQVFEDLGITRIWIFGDSMNSLFAWSILMRMGQYNLTDFNLNRSQKSGFNATLLCPASDDPTRIRRIPLMYGVSYSRFRLVLAKPEWIHENGANRVLLLINIGLHLNTIERLQYNFGNALNFLDSLNRTQDIIMWRNSNPGHKDCLPKQDNYAWDQPVTIAPFENYSEYKKTETDMFWWNNMEIYNEYTHKIIQQRNANDTGAHIRWFNTFNMTVLRRDGHVGGKDCLHYLLPGPLDWWVHMLEAYLRDIATIEGRQT